MSNRPVDWCPGSGIEGYAYLDNRHLYKCGVGATGVCAVCGAHRVLRNDGTVPHHVDYRARHASEAVAR